MEKKAALFENSRYRTMLSQRQLEELMLITCGVESCVPGYEYRTEDREGFHLHVILSGKGVLSVNGVETQLHFGQIFVTKPGEDTWYRADREDPWSYCWMAYDGTEARHYTEAAGLVTGTNWLNCRIDVTRFYTLVQNALEYSSNLTLSGDLNRLARLMEFLALAIESANRDSKSSPRKLEYSARVYVEYAVNYLQANYPNAKINDVAQQIGINRSYLTSIFRRQMGISPQEYLMQYRMDKAREMLLESDISVQEIALRVGYDNALTFSKIFKSYYDLSPAHYRREKREEREKKTGEE